MVDRLEVGEAAVNSALRKHLTEDLARTVRQAGIVVWQDDHGEYSTVARSMCPPDVHLAVFGGSWYALRREVEYLLAAEQPPQLIVYSPTAASVEDPLAEIRAAGREFKRRLPTLVRNALTGQLAAPRIEQIARDARTFEEAEAALGGSDAPAIRLISLLGAGDTTQMAVAVLQGRKDAAIASDSAWSDVAIMLGEAFGGTIAGEGDELRLALAQQVVLADIARAAGSLPDTLSSVWQAPSAEQWRHIQDLLQVWRYVPQMMASYRELASVVDRQLHLAATLPWSDGLQACVAVPSLEALCMTEALRRLGEDDASGALVFSEERLLDRNPWREERSAAADGRWGDRWRAVGAIAEVHKTVKEHPVPGGAISDVLDWYVARGWQVDRAHRKLELARGALPSYGDLEQHVTDARTAYDGWLGQLLQTTTDAIVADGLNNVTQIAQGAIHDEFVRGSDGLAAYIWVDALRYELGSELAEAIRRDITEHVTLAAATAGAPTITRVGMANLAPSAAAKLTLGLETGKLRVSIGEHAITTVEQRVELLRAAHGTVANLDLGSLSQQGEKELGRAVKGADLILVRSQEIDAVGESGLLNVAWPQFEATKQDLANAVAKLGQVGVRRIVITADHGFIALSQSVGDSRTIDAPIGGEGELHRRCWVGKGGTTSTGTARVPLVSLGLRSDLDAIVPKGLAVFKAGGGKQFFHGGLSPQELLIPVIVVDLEPALEPQKLDLEVAVAGGKITTGVFAATVEFHGDLFTNKVTFRVVARGGAGSDPVARVVSGDGYDPESGSVTIQTNRPSVLTFQVTANLEKDSRVEVQVLDARTGRRLAESVAAVAAPIVVEDQL
jgi:PglZ domain